MSFYLLDNRDKDELNSNINNSKSAAISTSAITLEEDNQNGAIKAYSIKQGGNLVGTINFPKDMVVESGEVVVNPEGQSSGTYIKLTLANVEEPLYINANSLVDIYVAAPDAPQVQVEINPTTRQIGARIIKGSISMEELGADVKNKLAEIDTEETRALMAESGLSKNITLEIARAKGVEDQIKVDLSGEIARAKAAEEKLTTDLNTEISRAQGAEGKITSDLQSVQNQLVTTNNNLINLTNQVNNMDVSLAALRLITDTMLEKDVLVDIRYFVHEFDDDYNRLFLDRDWTNIKFTDKVTMYNTYGFKGEALDLSSIEGSAKYITSQNNTVVPVTLGTQFSIELYGVFNVGEILADANYNIEISSNGTKFGAWYSPQGGNPYLETLKEYDLTKAHHIVLVGDIDKYKIYVDGGFDNEVDLSIQPNQDLLGNDNDIYIGGNNNASSHLIRFRVFDRALSKTEISSLYTSYWPAERVE